MKSAGVRKCTNPTDLHPKNVRVPYKKQQQQVVLQGPHGPIDLSTFERHSVDSVPAMATSNVSFDFVDALAEVAAKGGEGIQMAVRGISMQMTLPFDEVCACMQSVWFPEDWPPVISNQFMTWLGKHVFAGELEAYHNHLARLLGACCMPCDGLTLFKANCNFHTHQYHSSADMKMDIFASCPAGEICIANETPFASRRQWSGLEVDGKDDPIKDDKFHIADGVPWLAHHVNIGQIFPVG